jgi:hypothetical protein
MTKRTHGFGESDANVPALWDSDMLSRPPFCPDVMGQPTHFGGLRLTRVTTASGASIIAVSIARDSDLS